MRRLLCRLGLHAWYSYDSGGSMFTVRYRWRCGYCGKSRLIPYEEHRP